jgi:large subunit ribosomal protein L18
MYAQVVDDTKGHTLVSASTLDKEFKVEWHRGNVASARRVGELIGAKALEKGIKKLVFDRSGYIYHGAVKALADAARATGLEF